MIQMLPYDTNDCDFMSKSHWDMKRSHGLHLKQRIIFFALGKSGLVTQPSVTTFIQIKDEVISVALKLTAGSD